MTRRNPIPGTKLSLPSTSVGHWPPTCGQCGWHGEPNGDQTPYAACVIAGVADPQRHYRRAS